MIVNDQAKILQNPTITTLNGYPSTFTVTNKHYIDYTTTTYSGANNTPVVTDNPKDVDQTLAITITPWVSVDNIITMEIKPKITDYDALPRRLP